MAPQRVLAMHDPRQPKDSRGSGNPASPGSDPSDPFNQDPGRVVGEGETTPFVGSDAMSMPPGPTTEKPVLSVDECCLLDLIDGALVKKIAAPYNSSVELIDFSGLVELFDRLDTLRTTGLEGVLAYEWYPPAWARSFEDINLAFGATEDSFSSHSLAQLREVDTNAPDLVEYTLKLQRAF
jgi:hypothetical protein